MTQTILVVTNIPRPYRRALFGVLREQLATDDLRLRALYTSDPLKHVRRSSSSTVVDDPEAETFVHGIAFRTGYERVVAIPTDLFQTLTQAKPACVVVGGFGADAVITAYWCRAAKIPLVLWSGAWPGREGNIGRLSLMTRKRLVRSAQAFIAYGTMAADYLVRLGAHPNSVSCAWNTVDLEAVAAASRAAAVRRSDLTGKYGLAARNLVYVGTLVESKGVRELVSAALAAEASSSDWALHFVGAGPLRKELETTVRTVGREAHFRFHGLRPEGDVAELLGVADGLLLPTKRDAWGLVINEAMACGVPVVASPYAGATCDLIENGISGFVVEPTDASAMAGVISRLLSDDPACKEVGRAGAEVVRARASLDKSAEGFAGAIRCAMEEARNGRR